MLTINLDQNQETHKQLSLLLSKTNKANPNDKDIKNLKLFLREHPEICREASDLTEMAINNFVQKTDYSQSAKEILIVQAQNLRDDLGWKDASTLERLAVDIVVMSWMRWACAEIIYANKISVNHTLTSGQYWHKKLIADHNAYLRSCEALAKIRKLSRNTKEFMHDFSQGLPM